ncbi:MAG TPA: hypothetical protein VM598_12750 [Bdellovibrionota bacterium]|nr:hypothetical protein [Bdellovibrionota bacterium]
MAAVIGQVASAWAQEDTFALVGADEEGKAVEVRLDPREYAERLLAAMTLIQDSALQAVAARASDPRWSLKTVVVGVSVGAEISAGPILKLKAVPGFKLVFSYDQDPALP